MAPNSPATLRMPARDEGRDSLTLCVEAVADWAGTNVGYDAIHAALGLSFLTCVTAPTNSPADWATANRDWNLVEGARFLGLALRPLHPPAAAAGLRGVDEYHQHFVDSYAPLIRQAIEHNQPVLAWQGWPDDAARAWGIVTKVCHGPLGLAGVTPQNGDELVPLIAPIIQAYVVESVQPANHPPRDVMIFVLKAARTVLHNRVSPDLGLTTGPAAYDVWRSRLEQDLASTPRASETALTHTVFARSIADARESASRFLLHHHDAFAQGATGGLPASALDAIATQCKGTLDALEPLLADATIQAHFDAADGSKKLLAALAAAQNAERELAASIDKLVNAVGQ